MNAPALPVDRPLLGMGLRTVSSTSFAFMAAFLKAASERGADTMEMLFYRSVCALPLVLAWAAFGPGLASLRTRRPMAHLTRSVIGLSTMVFTFGALSRLPLGEATTITYTAPVFSTILSAIVLHEAIGGRRWAAVAIGFVGMLLVVRPGGGGGLAPVGVAMAVMAAFGQSAVMITLRQIGKTEHTAAIVFWFTSFGTLVGGALLPIFGHTHDATTYALLIGAGLCGGVGQIGLTSSLRFAPVSVVVPFDYLQIIWATFIGWVIFASPPASLTLAGAALITASGIYTAYRESRQGQQPKQALAPPEG
ncbi:DMT family transporter [Sphingomonas sp. BIUV-7]|uniref:DMT family transporter n=1 Tax=Sphingomonas natans TaxID=3063330 RepID=A0ABT8Y395_9SPHN|nr:DMT family transporter [Sphingomonas sp. BIUV-7]MDO6412772.1 DMT family transporter [Sphingomonas sp. BIUV-7]